MEKKFISVVRGYHKQIFSFEKDQNYHMMPLEVMQEEGYQCEIFAIDSRVRIEDDPNFVKGVKVIYYKNIFQYLRYLRVNRNYIIYSNSLTIKTLLVGMIGKKTVFYPHAYIFGSTKVKKLIIKFFYRFFTKIRVNNTDEFTAINKIKRGLAHIVPLAVSNHFLVSTEENNYQRKNGIFIGNLTSIKNPEFLIATCKILKKMDVPFIITTIGEDRYNVHGKSFSDLVNQEGLHDYFHFLGFVPHREIKQYLSTSLLYINTSHSEGQCLAVYEAALAGCYLCLPKILAFPSVFTTNAWYHTTPDDLARNIMFLLRHNKDGNEIKHNQSLILHQYNPSVIKEKMRHLFINNF